MKPNVHQLPKVSLLTDLISRSNASFSVYMYMYVLEDTLTKCMCSVHTHNHVCAATHNHFGVH